MDINNPIVRGKIAIGPQQIFGNPSLVISPLRQECLFDLQHGAAELSVSGTITYKDIFGEKYFTNFRSKYEWFASHLLAATPDHNDLN